MCSLRQALAFATLAILPLGLIVAETAGTTTVTKKKSTAKTRTTTSKSGSSTATSSTVKKGGTAGATTARRTTSTTRKRTTSTKGRTTASRPRQLQPTPERYKEIQQALAGKGYLKSEPSGTWNQESADALRRFQQDQNINASGKIDSLSLIALGLGPKRATNVTPPAPSEPKPEPPAPAGNGSDPEDLH